MNGIAIKLMAKSGVAKNRKGRRRPNRVRKRSDHVLKNGLIHIPIKPAILAKVAIRV